MTPKRLEELGQVARYRALSYPEVNELVNALKSERSHTMNQQNTIDQLRQQVEDAAKDLSWEKRATARAERELAKATARLSVEV